MFNSAKKFGATFLIATTGGLAGAYFFNHYSAVNSVQIAQSIPAHTVSYAGPPGTPADFTEAAESTVHGVVHVKTFYAQTSYNRQNFFDPFGFFDNPNQRGGQAPSSSGSGVIISDDGYIVTNNHVVDNAQKVEITLNNNQKYEGKVISTDPSTDLALVKIDAKNLSYIHFGNSDDVKTGQWVLAVGNPFDLTSTVTAGIVSAKARNINIIPNQTQPIESFIQTDAAVNPGNSGGALVNTNGELIGINTAIASNTGSYAGYAFAVPVNIVKKVVSDFMEFGTVQRAYLGISARDIDSDFAKEKGLKETQGVYIDQLTDDGGAKAAGLKQGDVVTKINDAKINSFPEMIEQIGRYRPGDKIKVGYLRGDEVGETTVVLKNKMGSTSVVKNDVMTILGGELTAISSDERAKLGIDGGVKVTNLGTGKLRAAGIKENFIITSIDNKAIQSTSDVQEALDGKKDGVLIEGVYPNGMRAWYGFGMK